MLINTPSIAVAQERVLKFTPKFCANPSCPWHIPSEIDHKKPFHRHGSPKIQRFPYISPRFRCRKCRKTFAASFFGLSFRDKKTDSYADIFQRLNDGASGRSIAETLGCDDDTIRRKKKKMCRYGLLLWARDLEKTPIRESVAFDGLENFSFSQYDPNNVNHAVGRESFFVYDFNLSPLNRKGRTSPRQKIRRNFLDEAHGKYDPHRIQKDSGRIFERLLAKSPGELILHSDNHYAYRKSIAGLQQKHRLVHLITPAKVHRNFMNRLFAINHTDMLTRHRLGSYKRETIAFTKNTVSMLESFVLFSLFKNYMRPQFTKRHVRRPGANKQSPAMVLGLRDRVLSFRDFFHERISVHHVKLSEDWQELFDSCDHSSRRYIRPYCGI